MNARFGSKIPGVSAEFQALFALLPDPALLVDKTKGLAVAVNAPFLQLTGLAAGAVIGRPAAEAFAEFVELPFEQTEAFPALLKSRSATPLGVTVQASSLSATLGMFVCRSQEDLLQLRLEQTQRAVWGLSLLGKLLTETLEGEEDLLQRGLKDIQDTFQADTVALYQWHRQVTGESEGMRRMIGCGQTDLLPERLSLVDGMHLSQSSMWRSGMRMPTGMHRAARVNGVESLLIHPFVQTRVAPGNAAQGNFSQARLLVVACRHSMVEGVDILLDALVERLSLLVRILHSQREGQALAATLEEELAIWQQTVMSANEGVLLLAADQTIRSMNSSAEWMLGYSEGEVQGKSIESILIGTDKLGVALAAAREGTPTFNMGEVVKLIRREGEVFPAQIQVLPVEGEGRILAYTIFINDVSENEESLQRTQQLEQRALLGEMSAVFAHDVINPINNLSSGLQVMQVSLLPEDANQETITRMLQDCDRLEHLMRSVLNFSRQTDYKFKEVDLGLLVTRLLDRWHPRMVKAGIKSQLLIDPALPRILGEPRALEQVFTNLISNAVEAMSAQTDGMLVVRLSPQTSFGHRQVQMTFSDNGPGILPEIRERMFVPFVTSKTQGTGLGLAISQRIVTAHKGSIKVESFPGGTIFLVQLPAVSDEMEGQA